MKSGEKIKCLCCGDEITLTNFTAHNQHYCTKKKCQEARAEARRNKWEKKHPAEAKRLAVKYSTDSRRRRSEREKATALNAAIAEIKWQDGLPQRGELLVGLAAFVCGKNNCGDIIAFITKLEINGRKLIASCFGGK